MPGDEQGQEYSIKLLSDVILYTERGIALVLKDLDYIYSSLYDLFNQNFSEAAGRKYCRVALGAQFNLRCFVHNEFHAIVFLPENRLEETDAPFLIDLKTTASRLISCLVVCSWKYLRR